MKKKALNFDSLALGIEIGSTRIKAIIIDANQRPIASGEYFWENCITNGYWSYDLAIVWKGLRNVYRDISIKINDICGKPLTHVGSIGISAMMHGYLPFDIDGMQLTPFRSWRNTTTYQSAKKLTSIFQFNIPQRWSIAHLYQAILNKEDHVKDINHLTTLAGYVHWKLTNEKILGIGEASGMFPIDTSSYNYNHLMLNKFDNLINDSGFNWNIEEILPTVKRAGEFAGTLTDEGARLLDPSGTLQAGIPFCPPEGDASTGMIATNSITPHTGNISAGTSIFAMIVLDKYLSRSYNEIDMVTTPMGKPVAMVHCNNFTSDINAWVNLFKQVCEATDNYITDDDLYSILFKQAMKADDGVGGLVGCNYYSGETITDFEEGRPLFVRMPDSEFTLPNFMKAHIFSALATLKIGMTILTEVENIKVYNILGHGGFFKTETVGQQLLSNAIKIPVSVMDTASEGGPWGMALLAAFLIQKQKYNTLEHYLEKVFSTKKVKQVNPTKQGMIDFSSYMERFNNVLDVERIAVQKLR